MPELVKLPKPLSVWTHKNGNAYMVMFLTNTSHIDKGHPPQVVYMGMLNHALWSRPLGDWHRSFTEVVGDTE